MQNFGEHEYHSPLSSGEAMKGRSRVRLGAERVQVKGGVVL